MPENMLCYGDNLDVLRRRQLLGRNKESSVYRHRQGGISLSDSVDRDSNVGKALITEHITGEMRRRNLDPMLLVFKWVDEKKVPLVLHIFRGSKRHQLMFSRADVEDLAMKPGLYDKYNGRILEAISKLLQER